LRFREEHGLGVLGNGVPSKTFGHKGEELTGDWRKLHNEELRDLYCSPNIVRVIKTGRIKWERHVACMGNRNA
jgi:hypothetical protein